MSTADYVAKYPRRQQLLGQVEKYWLDEPRRPPGSLDSSLKKHTTLLNRLKSSLLVGPSDTLAKEIDGLTLTKYLEEIVAAVVEGASKGRGDPEVAVDVIVHLHTRLSPDFLPLLLPQLLAVLAPAPSAPAIKEGDKDREREDKERIARQRLVLRIAAELAMVGAWAEGAAKGAAEVGKVLKALMSGDPQFNNIPLVASFLKYFNRAYLGPAQLAKDSKAEQPSGTPAVETEESEQLPADMTEMVPVEIQWKMRELVVGYFQNAGKTLVKGQIKLLEQDKRNHEAYIKSGEIFEDRQHAYERMTRAVERLTTGVQSLADLLSLSPPILPTAASLSKSGLQIVESGSSFQVKDDGSLLGGIWDDEEERNFYEELVDLKEVVPASLLGIKEKKEIKIGEGVSGSTETETEDREGEGKAEEEVEEARKRDEEDIRRQLEQLDLQTIQPSEPIDDVAAPGSVDMSRTATDGSVDSGPADLQSKVEDLDAEPTPTTESFAPVGDEDGLSSGPAARLTALFAALPEANNREVVDKLAVEFAFLNSKAARKRLVKFLGAVPKNRTDLLPHYGRFIATLDPYMPDVGTGVIELLEEELRYLQRKKNVRELDSVRLKNVRFYGELAKFKVARPYAILHVLKVFLDDFKWNIENISNLLETCGRFLLRYEGTAETAKSMASIELMRRKQGTSHLDARHQLMLENAFYQCNPPERVAREVVEIPPMHAFIQHLLHDVLMKRTLDKVLKLVRKLHWDDPEIYDYVLRSFTEIWEIKFGNIPYAAALVYDLQRYHPEFAIAVVDQILEDIRIGMEENIFKFNQRRISSVKYLGELYMYRVVNASVIFDVLWSLITFGHGDGLPVPGRDSPIDAVDDFFRIRLVCTLLDTCGACFDRGSQKRKLDHFLVIFQLYAACKSEMQMDVEFMLSDTLDMLRPKTPHLKTFAQAAAAVDELLASQAHAGDDSGTEEGSDDERAPAEDDEEEEQESNQPPIAVDNADDDEPDEEVVLIREPERKKNEFDEEANTDFDREFAKMLADTTDARRGERKAAPPIFDTAVPLIRKKAGEAGHEEGRMQFSLLSKRGNKQQVRDIEIPMDSAIAVNSRTYQLQNKAEQEQLKRLVLQNERRQEQSEKQAIEQDMRNRGIRVRYVNG
ncbi:hypothetical protein EHS25_000223 [Saitozyma podzolica]|uniref:MIF4G domain-containing protein n=1 Tax=Saitozyma podzolica TaxID=1890683 RepID=A0A427YVL6_9TREE|nr:hypothetical protein EHS25_000223 [Saitozyma podzolica]